MKHLNTILFYFSCALAVFLAVLLAFSRIDGLTWGQLITGSLTILVFFRYAMNARLMNENRRRSEETYISQFDGLEYAAAVEAAKREALALPHGLVRSKIKGSHPKWAAFERDAFQFVIASDSAGKARSYLI